MINETANSSPSGTIYLNGRFLGRPVTGVERFAGMIVREIDTLIEQGSRFRWEIAAPIDVERPDWLKNLPFRTFGRLKGHAWEQIDLWRHCRSGTVVNLCNSGPVLHNNQLTVIHDALVYRHPENFSWPYLAVHRTLGSLLSGRSRLATVSAFSRSELSTLLHVPVAKIAVISNAVDHMVDIVPDVSVLGDFGLKNRMFFLFVGSPAPNKNLLRAISAFDALGRTDTAFVIVGNAAKSFAASAVNDLPANVIATGRLTDEQIQALYQNAAALVFPSTYEGFGIPPLEAMRAGCLVLASDIAPVREVCGDAAVYFNPLDVGSITEAMRGVADRAFEDHQMTDRARRRAEDFSWRRSATLLMAQAEEVAARHGAASGGRHTA